MPTFARHSAFDQPEILRVLTEHVELRRRALDLEAGANPERKDGGPWSRSRRSLGSSARSLLGAA